MPAEEDSSCGLCFDFRGKSVPVSHVKGIDFETAKQAMQSEPFRTWVARCETEHDNKKIDISSVEIQSVDMFGKRGVGFVKIKADCTLIDGETHHKHKLPGICFLRGSAVSIFVALFCEDDGSVHTLLVNQPRVPVGQVSSIELPAGMIDDEKETIVGTAVKEMEEECGIIVEPADLIDLTALACRDAVERGHLPLAAVAPSPGGCDEFCRMLYMEKKVTKAQLKAMRGRLQGLRQDGEFITLMVVPMEEVWRISGDMKAMVSMFLVEKLREEEKLPLAGVLAKPLHLPEPTIELSTGVQVPQLAFGLYKVPADTEGEAIILNAVQAGYRHFDTASYYGNEATLGRALKRSGVPREDFFIASKVWNDAVRQGRRAVRESVEKSVKDLDFGGYFDLFLVHWPVPDHFVDAYKELEILCKQGIVKSIGLSNFSIQEYETLCSGGIEIPPVINQIETSPVMYRKELIQSFQEKGIVVGAFKALNRAAAFDAGPIQTLALKYKVAPAQIMLRWALQKRLIVVAKTSNKTRMQENRSIFHFELTHDDVEALDGLTTEEAMLDLTERETLTKTSL